VVAEVREGRRIVDGAGGVVDGVTVGAIDGVEVKEGVVLGEETAESEGG